MANIEKGLSCSVGNNCDGIRGYFIFESRISYLLDCGVSLAVHLLS